MTRRFPRPEIVTPRPETVARIDRMRQRQTFAVPTPGREETERRKWMEKYQSALAADLAARLENKK